MKRKIILVSRCAWTLYNFRQGLIRALRDDRQEVIGGGAGGDGYEEKIRDLGIPFFPLPVDKRGTYPPGDLRLFWTLYRWYRRERPELVHHFTIKPVIYGSLAARLAGVPAIVNTITGLGHVFMEEGGWLRRLVEAQYRMALAAAHLSFFQNREDRDLFLRRGLVRGPKTGLLAGSGVDIRSFRPGTTAGEQPPGGPVVFLLVARLLREKGIYEFIAAARQVKKTFPAACFQLLGKRDERNPSVIAADEVQSWQDEGLVDWLGEAEDVRPLLAKADVVVLPSYREGLSRSLLEGSAMAKPLIATDVVGCREVVDPGRTGLLVPPRDGPALAEAMIWMIRHPEERMAMGRTGRAKVERDFDERTVLRTILAAYDRLSDSH